MVVVIPDELFLLSGAQTQLLVNRSDEPVARIQLVTPVNGLDPTVLAERWRDATGRHDALRLVVTTKPGLAGLFQGLGDARAPLTVADPGTDPTELAASEWASAAGLGDGTPVRVALAGPTLVLTALAAAADARTLRLLADELTTGTAPSGDPLSFLDFASWEHDHLEEDSAEARVARAYWRGLLDGPAPSSAPAAERLGSVPVPVPPSTDAGTWLAALVLATGETSPASDEATTRQIAVAVSARTDEELEVALGPYERYVPLVIPAAAAGTTVATLRSRLLADLDAASRFALFAPAAGPLVALSQHEPGLRPALGRHPVELVVTGDRATLWFDVDRVEDREAAWLAERIGRAAATAGDILIEKTDLLGDDELEFLDDHLRGEDVSPAYASVVDAVAAHARSTPDALAVVHGEEQVTYGELAAHASALAAELDGAHGPVGILLDRGPQAVTAAVGVMWGGHAYAALEPSHPPQRMADQLAAAGIDTVVTTADRAEQVPVSRVVVPAGRPSGEVTPPAVAADDVAYLLFTSGSTGTPKPVAVTHANLAAYAAGVSRRLGFDASSRLAAVTGLSTDLGNTSVFGALFNGGTVEVVPEEDVSSAARLGDLVAAHQITGLKITPSHLRALLAAGDRRLDLPLVVCGGEPLDTALVTQARAAGVGRVVNHYGPTETTVGVLTHETTADETDPVPLGRPLPHARLRVVDAHGRPVPVGHVGELEVSGAAVTAGYVGDAAAGGFGAAEDGTRRYRTGDLVRLRLDGEVLFVGRRDGQVKVRGYRVDLGDVESHLRAETNVADAAVTVADDALRAFVVGTDAGLDTRDLIRRLGERLPPHMVPGGVVVLTDLPRTPSGKVDRRALASLEASAAADERVGRAPTTDTEQALLEIWRDVVPGTVAGVDDNFFQIGGHSLMATKVIARSRAAFSVDVPLHVIFASPTVASMAAEIDARLEEAGRSQEDETDTLLRELDGLSDAEVARLLGSEGATPAQDD